MKKAVFNVINFHCIDSCNFHCKHCFVSKNNKIVDLNKAKSCIDKISDYFKLNKIKNGRINLAGGEPFLYPHLRELIEHINSKGILISIITNGSLVNKQVLDDIFDKIDMIGISIDGLSKDVNSQLGRCTEKNIPDYNWYLDKCSLIKNYGIKLKVNICVSEMNKGVDFTAFLDKVNPERLKILQMVVQDDVNMDASKYIISSDDFEKFVQKYERFKPIVESSDDIENSYLILDSNCCISTNNNHKSTISLLDCSLNDAIKQIKLNDKKFYSRYL